MHILYNQHQNEREVEWVFLWRSTFTKSLAALSMTLKPQLLQLNIKIALDYVIYYSLILTEDIFPIYRH